MFIQEHLYKEIIKIMPVPCVDLLVVNQHEEILMLKRRNEPASGQWWFPGGRVLHGETRQQAALRKLKEECGTHSDSTIELRTYDLFIPLLNENFSSHAITTVFQFRVHGELIILDNQSSDFTWKSADAWMKITKHQFVQNVLIEWITNKTV